MLFEFFELHSLIKWTINNFKKIKPYDTYVKEQEIGQLVEVYYLSLLMVSSENPSNIKSFELKQNQQM